MAEQRGSSVLTAMKSSQPIILGDTIFTIKFLIKNRLYYSGLVVKQGNIYFLFPHIPPKTPPGHFHRILII